ncbi:MAG: hypothetical protein ABGW69_00355 [Nanoarchaeota archaeon]
MKVEEVVLKLNKIEDISITSYKQEEEKSVIKGFYNGKEFFITLYRNTYIIKIIEKGGVSKSIEGTIDSTDMGILRDLKMLGSRL